MWKKHPTLPGYQLHKTRSLILKSMDLVRLAYDDKIDKIQEFINAYPEDCSKMQTYCVNGRLNVLLYALLRKQFKAYAVLMTSGFELLYDHTGKTKKFEKLTEDELIALRQEIRQRYIPSDVFMTLQTDMSPLVKKLMRKTKLASNRYYMRFFKELRGTYEELEAMKEVRPILVIIAHSEELEIVCEFFQRYVGYTLPGMPFSVAVCDFNTHIILVCCNRGHNHVLALMVHEFIHYVMFVLYCNRSLPFVLEDTERKAEFETAYEACEVASKSSANSDLEKFEIFSLKEKFENEIRAEAITLPATNPIEYKDDDTVVERYQVSLAPLYDFYKKYTLPDIIRKSQQIEAELENDEENEIVKTNK